MVEDSDFKALQVEIANLHIEQSNLKTDLAVILNRLANVEKRCDTKEKDVRDIKDIRLRPIEAWQNKAIGYAAAFAFLASLIGSIIVDFFKR